MSSTLRKLAVALGSVVVMAALFLLAEAGMRLFDVQPREWPAAGLRGTLPQLRVDPLLGALPRPGWRGRWFQQFEAEFDDNGFRASGLPPPAAARARVAFAGDSCTFGWGLDTPDTFIARLDARQRAGGAPTLALINAAYPGQSAVVGEHVLSERVLPLHPDVVVIGYGANNAFRFAIAPDRARFRAAGLRRWIFRSRLLHWIAAELATRRGAAPDPRRRALVEALPLAQVHRVASPAEFAAAERAMVRATRAAGAVPILLVFPRASAVSELYPAEDAARARDRPAPGQPPSAAAETRRLRNLLEVSCLDPHAHGDPLAELATRAPAWRPVYPDDPDVRARLRAGAADLIAGRVAEARAQFAAAVAADPQQPLAHYDLGLALIAAGEPGAGLAALERADALACSAFLHYQVVLWRLALEEHVAVVDLTPWFQAHADAPLFLDPAHPNAAGAALVADALEPAIAAALAAAEWSAAP